MWALGGKGREGMKKGASSSFVVSKGDLRRGDAGWSMGG